MNIHEASTSGRPFTNPDMFGAWMIVDGELVHRDNIRDFNDMEWIRSNCVGDRWTDKKSLYWMTVSDLMRSDWVVI